MFIHLGSNTVVDSKEIIGIFNLTKTHVLYKKLWNKEQKDIEIKNLSKNGENVSCVLTEKVLYLSPISVATLRKRASGKIQLNTLDLKGL
jgi:hypothetical protein